MENLDNIGLVCGDLALYQKITVSYLYLITGTIGRRGVMITTAGNLSAKRVIHLDVNGVNGKNDWKKAISKCLQEAEKAQLSSLSFPALGTGMCAILIAFLAVLEQFR